MNRMCKVFFQNLFGARQDYFIRTGFICLLLFGSLSIADYQVPMKPSILYLMVSTFTAGVMWQGLSSETCAAHMQHMLMLPFAGREFVFSYIAAVGLYTFLTKTAVLLAVVLAVSVWSWAELLGSILCAVNAILMTAAIFSWKGKWHRGAFWIAAVLAVLFFCWEKPWFLPLLLCNSILAVLSLRSADGYAFYLQGRKSKMARGRKRYWLWIYFVRYLGSRKNYLANIAILWCMACVFPFFYQAGGKLVYDSPWFCHPFPEHAYLYFAVLRSRFRAGRAVSAQSEEKFLHSLLCIYFLVQSERRWNLSL